jgi:hypothetical protein
MNDTHQNINHTRTLMAQSGDPHIEMLEAVITDAQLLRLKQLLASPRAVTQEENIGS